MSARTRKNKLGGPSGTRTPMLSRAADFKLAEANSGPTSMGQCSGNRVEARSLAGVLAHPLAHPPASSRGYGDRSTAPALYGCRVVDGVVHAGLPLCERALATLPPEVEFTSGYEDVEGAPTERAPAPPFPLEAARASLTELALRAGIAVMP